MILQIDKHKTCSVIPWRRSTNKWCEQQKEYYRWEHRAKYRKSRLDLKKKGTNRFSADFLDSNLIINLASCRTGLYTMRGSCFESGICSPKQEFQFTVKLNWLRSSFSVWLQKIYRWAPKRKRNIDKILIFHSIWKETEINFS